MARARSRRYSPALTRRENGVGCTGARAANKTTACTPAAPPCSLRTRSRSSSSVRAAFGRRVNPSRICLTWPARFLRPGSSDANAGSLRSIRAALVTPGMRRGSRILSSWYSRSVGARFSPGLPGGRRCSPSRNSSFAIRARSAGVCFGAKIFRASATAPKRSE